MKADSPHLTPQAAVEALRWWIEAGVDLVLDEIPHDRFAAPAPKPAEPRRAASIAPTPAPILAATMAPPDEAARNARELAQAAQSLEALRAALETFTGCGLKNTATQLVFADGAPGSPLMLVGEAPGADEDRVGRPFVGKAGQLLDRMLAAIGLDRTSVYIANVVPWRPPGNRTPTPQETQICLPFIQRQIELVDPDILVTLGNPSTQTLLSTREGIMRTRGRWFDYDTGTRTIRAIATFHPAYLLRSPSYKRMSWQDLRAIAKALAG